MDELEQLRAWGARVDATNATPIDVTAQVLATLRQRRREQTSLPMRPLLVVAAASVLAAVSLGFTAQQSWAELSDPMVSLVSPYLVILP